MSSHAARPETIRFPPTADQPRHVLPGVRGAGWLAVLAFAAVLFGSKLWFIGTYGNATPFWDQWSAEAGLLYRPYLAGGLSWADLVAPANEHRIFTTRLLDLALLRLNGIWNPLLQMVVNAALHVLMLCLLVGMLARTIGREHLPVLLTFTAVFFSVPFGWENALWGFQAQFYLVLLFGVASLWLTSAEEPLSGAWWAGAACAVLALLSFGSGTCAAVAAAAVALSHYAFGLRRTRRQLIAAAILAGLSLMGVALTPTLPYHAGLKASSISQFLHAWNAVLSWPISSHGIASLIVNLPVLIFAGVVLRRRPPAESRLWFLAALIGWALVQTVIIAYSRAACALATRYLDLFSIGILTNLACAIWLAQDRLHKRHAWMAAGAPLWAAAILVCLGVYTGRHVPSQLDARRDTAIAQQSNVKAYLATGDVSYLKDKPLFQVPYPDYECLASFLASPEIRSILPANIRSDARTGRLDKAVTHLLASYHLFLMAGLATAVALLLQHGLAGDAAASVASAAERLNSPASGFNIDDLREEPYRRHRAS